MSTSTIVDVRAIGLDNLSELRHVHSLAFKSYLGPDISEDQLDGLLDFVYSPAYVEQLLSTECLGGWVGGRLCVTASWMPGGSMGTSAKLVGVCVDPLFGGLGLARRMVSEVEQRARRAGFAVMTARAPIKMASFFERVGYSGTSRGIWSIPGRITIPVLHMRKGEAKSTLLTGRQTASELLASRSTGPLRVH